MRRSEVTSPAIAEPANMVPARHAAWKETSHLAMNASLVRCASLRCSLRSRFGNSLHDLKGVVRGEATLVMTDRPSRYAPACQTIYGRALWLVAARRSFLIEDL